MNTVICACGCGQQFESNSASARYIHGHQNFRRRGYKQSPEWVQKKAQSMKVAWKDPAKFPGMRQQSPEFVEKRISKLRGRTLSPEARDKVSQGLTGRKLSPEHRLKVIKNLKIHVENLCQKFSPEVEKRRRESISKARIGTHGFGRSARDNPLHAKALHWIIRDSRGVTYEFNNLRSWCRLNEHRFLPDERPFSKLPLWMRAISGFNGQQRSDRKGQHTWRGWTLVSVTELETLGAPDPLDRISK